MNKKRNGNWLFYITLIITIIFLAPNVHAVITDCSIDPSWINSGQYLDNTVGLVTYTADSDDGGSNYDVINVTMFGVYRNNNWTSCTASNWLTDNTLCPQPLSTSLPSTAHEMLSYPVASSFSLVPSEFNWDGASSYQSITQGNQYFFNTTTNSYGDGIYDDFFLICIEQNSGTGAQGDAVKSTTGGLFSGIIVTTQVPKITYSSIQPNVQYNNSLKNWTMYIDGVGLIVYDYCIDQACGTVGVGAIPNGVEGNRGTTFVNLEPPESALDQPINGTHGLSVFNCAEGNGGFPCSLSLSFYYTNETTPYVPQPMILTLSSPNGENLTVAQHNISYTSTSDVNTSIPCSVYVNDVFDTSANVINNTLYTYEKTFSTGFNTVYVNCTDDVSTVQSNVRNYTYTPLPIVLLNMTVVLSSPNGENLSSSIFPINWTATSHYNTSIPCQVYVNDALDNTVNVVNNTMYSYSGVFANGLNNVYVNCTDFASMVESNHRTYIYTPIVPPVNPPSTITDDLLVITQVVMIFIVVMLVVVLFTGMITDSSGFNKVVPVLLSIIGIVLIILIITILL